MFSMSRLMNIAEMDAFTAEKVAGSKTAYCDLLEGFLAAAKAIADTLKSPQDSTEVIAFITRLLEFQKLLLGIRSSPLVWKIDRVIETARDGDRKKCRAELFDLMKRLKALCEKIEQSRFDANAARENFMRAAGEAEGKMPAGAPVADGRAGKPQGAIEPETFEKLGLLIDDFEYDAAMAMLRKLADFTYNPEIDAALAGIGGALARFDQEDAALRTRRLVELAAGAVKSDSAGKRESRRILAVDDMPDVLNTVKAVLGDKYSFYGVTSGDNALKFLTSNRADLILIDIEMPHMNGFNLLEIIRKLDAYKATPVIFLTGSATLENVQKSMQVGGNDFVCKPINAPLLWNKVARHLS